MKSSKQRLGSPPSHARRARTAALLLAVGTAFSPQGSAAQDLWSTQPVSFGTSQPLQSASADYAILTHGWFRQTGFGLNAGFASVDVSLRTDGYVGMNAVAKVMGGSIQANFSNSLEADYTQGVGTVFLNRLPTRGANVTVNGPSVGVGIPALFGASVGMTAEGCVVFVGCDRGGFDLTVPETAFDVVGYNLSGDGALKVLGSPVLSLADGVAYTFRGVEATVYSLDLSRSAAVVPGLTSTFSATGPVLSFAVDPVAAAIWKAGYSAPGCLTHCDTGLGYVDPLAISVRATIGVTQTSTVRVDPFVRYNFSQPVDLPTFGAFGVSTWEVPLDNTSAEGFLATIAGPSGSAPLRVSTEYRLHAHLDRTFGLDLDGGFFLSLLSGVVDFQVFDRSFGPVYQTSGRMDLEHIEFLSDSYDFDWTAAGPDFVEGTVLPPPVVLPGTEAPEPGALALVATGLLAMGAIARRRRA